MANESRNTPVRPAHMVTGPLKSLVAQVTTGGGTAFQLPGAFSAFGIEVVRAAAATNSTLSTAATIQLQGRIGSTNWRNLGSTVTANSVTGTIARSTNSIPVNEVRLQITAFTTGAAKPAVTGWINIGTVSS